MRMPASCLKLSRSSTSIPVSTFTELPEPRRHESKLPQALHDLGVIIRRLLARAFDHNRISHRTGDDRSDSPAQWSNIAFSIRMHAIQKNTTNISLAGSIQIDVPVKPVWPNEPSGNSSPRLVEKLVLMSQPSPRVLPLLETIRGRVICATVKGESTRTPPYEPPFRIIWQ